ncbi:MAG: penicillin-binding protein 2, partial [Paracoccaceae bacterium]
DKPKRGGGYYKNKVINTFASVFPANDPAYVLIVSLDEPTVARPHHTAGWTAVPVAAEIVRRTAPLLGLRPQVDPAAVDAVTAVNQ